MTQIAKKEVEVIEGAAEANSNSGGNQNPPPRSTPSWKMPWWLFHLLKFIIEMSPALGREISLLLEDFMLSVIHLWGVFKKLLKWIKWAAGAMLLYIALSLSENVFKIEIPWYLIALPPVLSLAILILVLFFRKKEKNNEQEDSALPNEAGSYWEKKKRKITDWWNKWWVKGRLLPILACFAFIHLSFYKLAPKFWMAQAWGDWSSMRWFWGIPIAIGIAAAVKPEDKTKPAKYKFSTFAVFLLVITFVIHLTGWSPEDKIEGIRSGWGSSAQASTTRTPGQSVYVTTERGIIPPGTLKYPREGTFENKEVAERVLAGQWDLLAACFRESEGMKQFRSKGQVLVYKNIDEQTKKVTSIDRGACMINSQHDARIPNHPDADTLVGNLEFAKILYNEGKTPNKRGLKPWTPHLTKEEFVFEVPVDADGTKTNTFIFPYEDITKYSFHPSVATTVIVTDLDNVEHTLDIYPITERDPIAGGPVADKIRSYRFEAKDGKASVVTVTYRYK